MNNEGTGRRRKRFPPLCIVVDQALANAGLHGLVAPRSDFEVSVTDVLPVDDAKNRIHPFRMLEREELGEMLHSRLDVPIDILALTEYHRRFGLCIRRHLIIRGPADRLRRNL